MTAGVGPFSSKALALAPVPAAQPPSCVSSLRRSVDLCPCLSHCFLCCFFTYQLLYERLVWLVSCHRYLFNHRGKTQPLSLSGPALSHPTCVDISYLILQHSVIFTRDSLWVILINVTGVQQATHRQYVIFCVIYLFYSDTGIFGVYI